METKAAGIISKTLPRKQHTFTNYYVIKVNLKDVLYKILLLLSLTNLPTMLIHKLMLMPI